MIPQLIYAMEVFEGQLILLSKKTKVRTLPLTAMMGILSRAAYM
jgi:hypothetical protein